jgi:hypothetical protein
MSTSLWQSFAGTPTKIYFSDDLLDQIGIAEGLPKSCSAVLKFLCAFSITGVDGFLSQHLCTLIDYAADLEAFTLIAKLRLQKLAKDIGAIGNAGANWPNEAND